MKWRRREKIWEVVFRTCKLSTLEDLHELHSELQCCLSREKRGAELRNLRSRKPSTEKELDNEGCVVLWLAELRVKHLPTLVVREEKGTGARVTKRKSCL